MNRRYFLRSAAALSLGSLCLDLQLLAAAAATSPKRKILFFTKSSGYEHEAISYKKGQPSIAEKTLLELGPQHGFEFTFSKDGSLFSPDYLKQFDALFFYTTGDLCSPGTDQQPPMSVAGKQALLDYVASGKGFIGTHSATDTFHTDGESEKGPERYKNHGAAADPYVRMIGGEFIKHNKQQKARMRAVDPKFPGCEQLQGGFEMHEEWYSLKDFSEDLHVLLVQETETMEGDDYKRPPYPATWARMHHKGRVFYTSMGHRDDVWGNPSFQSVLIGGISWAVGNVEADMKPNLREAAPHADQNPAFKPKAARALHAPNQRRVV